MAVFRWQYPAQAKPFDAALYDPALLHWIFYPTDQFPLPPSPVFIPDPTVIDLSVYPQNLDWLQPIDQPLVERERPIVFDVPFTFDPTLEEVAYDWDQPTNQPVLEVQHPTGFDVPFIVEPTLHIEQNLDWLQQTNQPVFEPPFPTIVFVPGQFEPADFVVITWTTITEPFAIFLYTAANWPPTAWYLEVVMRATSGTAHARLWDMTSGTAVAASEITTTSATFTRIRSGVLSLTDGSEYRAQFGTIDADAGKGVAARLIGI